MHGISFEARPYRLLMLALRALLVALSIFLIVIVFANVVGRYVFNYSLAWAEEASRFIFIWVIFIGSVLANEKYEHMNLDILIQWLKADRGRIVQIIAQVIILVVLAMVIRGGWIATVENLSWTSPAMEISYGLVYSIVPFTCIIMCYQTFIRIVLIGQEIARNKR
jgi:TRAP-type transport system small permease protein